MKGKQLRLRRLFGRGRTVIVPMDHPVYFGPIPGVEDPVALVRDVASTPADGILLTPATLGRVADVAGSLAAVARLDGTHSRIGSRPTVTERFASVEMALAAGADACVLNIYVGAENERDLLLKLGETAEACERWGLPLVGEMIPAEALAGHYGMKGDRLSEEELADQVALASRIGAEMGADLIKTSYTGSAESFRRVVEGATVPVVVAGGPRDGTTAGFLRMVEECMAAGAAGICAGRNVWQRDDRVAILKAICRIAHDGLSAEDALAECIPAALV